MKLTDILLAAGIIGGIGYLINSGSKEGQPERKEKRTNRENIPCSFNEGITEEEFKQVVQRSRKRIKRVRLSTDGPIVYGTVESNSGISEWEFSADFNDYGHLTGQYWLSSDNDDSVIPEIIADKIANEIRQVNSNKKIEKSDNQNTEDDVPIEDNTGQETINEALITDAKKTNEATNTETSPKKQNRHIKGLVVAMIIAALIGLGWYEYTRIISVQYSNGSLVGMPFDQVERCLSNAGFTHIFVNDIADLDLEDKAADNIVTGVRIGLTEGFEKDSKFPANFPIIVSFHSIKRITAPMTSKQAKGKDYKEIVQEFENAGFLDVSANALNDIIIGLLVNEGDVDSISIGGNIVYSTGDEYRPDEPVEIYYHSR